MRWVTREEMRELDRRAIEECGIPALVLMENAGRGAAAEAARLYRERGLRGPVLVFCGAGNNGGDGFVIARHMSNAGFDIRIFCCFDRAKADREREAGTNLTICERMGLSIHDVFTQEAPEGLRADLVDGALLVDAVFGVGLSKPPREPYFSLLRLLDRARLTTLAVDVPSGLDANTGEPLGIALRADVTATMACPKVGMRGPGAAWVGRLAVVDIGMPVARMAAL